MTRSSTPKYDVIHIDGCVVLTGVSKTEANQIARAMNKGNKKKRIMVRPATRQAAA